MAHNLFCTAVMTILCCYALSSQVLLDPDQKLLDEYRWIYNTNIKHACKTADSNTVIETSVEKCNFIDNFSMYPNPATDIVNVEFTAKPRPTVIYIAGFEGELIKSVDLSDFSGKYDADISLNNMVAGIYVMTIRQGDETFVRKLVVK